jgi:hypothetical protein
MRIYTVRLQSQLTGAVVHIAAAVQTLMIDAIMNTLIPTCDQLVETAGTVWIEGAWIEVGTIGVVGVAWTGVGTALIELETEDQIEVRIEGQGGK